MNAKPKTTEPAGTAAVPNAGALTYISLAALKPGHEHPAGDINARKYGRGEVDDLIPLIRQFGVLVPLVIKGGGEDSRFWYVVEGNRRLAALQAMIPDKDRAAFQVPTIQQGAGDPLEISMMLNSARRDLHPVDEYEVFQVLIQAGATVEELAAKYLMKPSQVRQALGLAKLAPEVRAAWREGKISDGTAEAFLLTSDHKTQVSVLKRHGKSGAWEVRRALGGQSVRVGGLLKFVGREVYEAAGHFVNETLFSEGHRDDEVSVSDLAALKTMADDKVEAACDKLKAEGWSWVMPKEKAPNDIYSWKRVHPGGNGKFSAELMAASGCTVSFDQWNGTIEVARGYVKPGSKVQLPKGATQTPEQKKAAAKKKAERDENGPAVSNALARRISEQMTLAAADVLAAHPRLALSVAIASLACLSSPTTIDLRDSGQDGQRKGGERDENDFGEYLRLSTGHTTEQALKVLATWVAQGVDLTCWRADCLPLAPRTKHDDSGAGELLALMPPAAVTKAMRERFDAEDYFASMSAAAAKEALRDMGIQVTKAENKSALAKQAAGTAKLKGWLPPEMRVPGAYDGPGAKSERRAKPKSGAKSKRKTRL